MGGGGGSETSSIPFSMPPDKLSRREDSTCVGRRGLNLRKIKLHLREAGMRQEQTDEDTYCMGRAGRPGLVYV